MIAVIETGGKQYLVKTGDTISIEKLEVEPGKEIIFDKVLLTANDDGSNALVGMPYLPDVKINAVCIAQGRTPKLRVTKYKRKVRYRRIHGHRQHFTKATIK